MNGTEKILNDFADSVINDIRSNYETFGLKASGAFGRSLEKKITKSNTQFKLIIKANHYGYFMEYGRKPTAPNKRGRLYRVILNWARVKGIQTDNIKRFAYFAAKKIDEKGIKVPNKFNPGKVLTSVINDERIDDLRKQLTEAYIIEAKSDIIKDLKGVI